MARNDAGHYQKQPLVNAGVVQALGLLTGRRPIINLGVGLWVGGV